MYVTHTPSDKFVTYFVSLDANTCDMLLSSHAQANSVTTDSVSYIPSGTGDTHGGLFVYIGPDWRVVVADWGVDASGRYSPTVALAQHQEHVYASHSHSAAKGCTYVMPCLPYRTTTLMYFPRPDRHQKGPLMAIVKKHGMCCCPIDKDKRSYEILTTHIHVGRCKRCIQLCVYREVCDIYDTDKVKMYELQERRRDA